MGLQPERTMMRPRADIWDPLGPSVMAARLQAEPRSWAASAAVTGRPSSCCASSLQAFRTVSAYVCGTHVATMEAV